MGKNVDHSKCIESLENRISCLERLVKTLAIRLGNNEELSLDFIVRNHRYQDLSPEKAFNFYSSKDKNFILLDVSSLNFRPIADFPEVLNIPFEDFESEFPQLPNKAASILVISEDGIKSILACEYLAKLGYYNLNNVSGGYKYWIGHNNLRSIKPQVSQSA